MNGLPVFVHSGVPFDERWLSAKVLMYQVCGYVVLNLLDDPAWLALIFC